jgi:hypothetical protein
MLIESLKVVEVGIGEEVVKVAGDLGLRGRRGLVR